MDNLDYFWIIIAVVSHMLATTFIWLRFGKVAALATATLGLAYIIYLFGKVKGKEDIIEHAEKVHAKREKKYNEIDNRDLTRDDIVKRLRDKSY